MPRDGHRTTKSFCRVSVAWQETIECVRDGVLISINRLTVIVAVARSTRKTQNCEMLIYLVSVTYTTMIICFCKERLKVSEIRNLKFSLA